MMEHTINNKNKNRVYWLGELKKCNSKGKEPLCKLKNDYAPYLLLTLVLEMGIYG